MAADFAALGVSVAPDAVTQAVDVFEVWRVNWKAVTSFLTVETQWRVLASPAGLIWLGLDYTAAAATLRGRSDRLWRHLLSELRIMEHAALDVLNAEQAE
ncbi:DUF1799 domain-containing protein [Roseibium porphyridii]|uniref:DUF1799 domain-containing protein n=1 Tax=Roseibium porphyridii TaxID=2866279 RepID=A0ABY8F9X5_9HYPH|nr:DUF1799 domain-containing protein [Roseibium sp. KMA01]WFE92307.1 DUF1799 domain-containing protein [Roseibium sp. KMA01]